MERPRRRTLILGLVAGVGTVLAGGAARGKAKENEEEVSPVEDLMREHGVLRRVLLVYDEALRRLDGKRDFPAEEVRRAADIVRRFIEDYHEKLEEDFVFPRFEKAERLVELVGVLRTQHRAGRALTDRILRLPAGQTIRGDADRGAIVDALTAFIVLYRPHAAREDTVLFPAFRRLVGNREYAELGERFEDRERELFGKDGFEGMVQRVGEIEQALGLYDLARFTPPTP